MLHAVELDVVHLLVRRVGVLDAIIEVNLRLAFDGAHSPIKGAMLGVASPPKVAALLHLLKWGHGYILGFMVYV